MPCYIRYLLSAVHTTWSGFKLCGGGWDVGWKWRGGKHENWEWGEGRVRPGPVMWSLSLSLNCYLPAGSGVFNLTLYSTIWEFIATSTRDCSGIKWLICLCYPRPIRGELYFLVCQEIFLWAALFTSLDRLSLALDHWLRAQQSLILIFLTPMTRRWALSYLTLACFLTLTCQVAIL